MTDAKTTLLFEHAQNVPRVRVQFGRTALGSKQSFSAVGVNDRNADEGAIASSRAPYLSGIE
uniref:hypothetical protein n=1 Tax=Ruegeria arenilitoris TaxID=1173585 RepID=UPI001C2BE1FE